MLKIIKVTGNSLSPFFLPGDYAIVWRAPRHFKQLAPGDIVVFEHIQYGRMIKKVVSNDLARESLQVEGTHPNSISSQKLGPIPYRDIVGKVIHRSSP